MYFETDTGIFVLKAMCSTNEIKITTVNLLLHQKIEGPFNQCYKIMTFLIDLKTVPLVFFLKNTKFCEVKQMIDENKCQLQYVLYVSCLLYTSPSPRD